MKTRAHVQDEFQYGGVRVLWVQESREHGAEAIGWPTGGHLPDRGAEGPDGLPAPSGVRWERDLPQDGYGVTTTDRGLILRDDEARALMGALLAHYGIPQAEDRAQAQAAAANMARADVLQEALEVERRRVDAALERQAFPMRVVDLTPGEANARAHEDWPQYVVPKD